MPSYPRCFVLFAATLGYCALAAPPDARVESLLQKMTLEEKIGQLTQIGGIALMPDKLTPEERVRRGQAGSILWVSDPVQINKLQKIAVEQTRLKIPVIVGLDVIHGFKTIFPMPLAMAASWDTVMVEQVQAAAAREARLAGIHWTFAPMVDIARDPRWGRIVEGAGEDPFLGAAIARAQVRGFQGTALSDPASLLACAKHFAAYGAADGGRDYDSSYVPEEQMWNVYLPPFEAALRAGAGTFMSSYQDLNDVPGTANKFTLQRVLRQAWGFNGFVVSDANSVRDLLTHGFARDASDAAFRALTAGVDMDMASRTYLDQLAALVKSGRLPVKVIDDAVRRILAAKFQLGLFEHPYADEALAIKLGDFPEHRALARDAAAKSAVLLRNEGGLLPLPKTSGRVAVIGPLADSKPDLYTMWAGFSVDYSKGVTIAEGIRNKLGSGAQVETAPGVELRKQYLSMFDRMFRKGQPEPWPADKSNAEFQRAVDTARRADVIVMVLGETMSMDAEMASKSTLSLPGRQQELLEAVASLGKPVVLVLINGRPLNISWAAEHVPAILEAWHPGQEGGNAVADLLFGDAAPSGRLPLTWPRTEGQIPVYYAHNLTHSPETAPDFTSRYWDIASSPLFPFGYGLTYTKFAYSNLKLKESTVRIGSPVVVEVDVQNTGARPGEEVAQLYIHQQAGSASRPVRELKGFAKISLDPGARRTLTFRLGNDELRYWSGQERRWVVEPETFDVWVGGDSTASLHGTFKLVKAPAKGGTGGGKK